MKNKRIYPAPGLYSPLPPVQENGFETPKDTVEKPCNVPLPGIYRYETADGKIIEITITQKEKSKRGRVHFIEPMRFKYAKRKEPSFLEELVLLPKGAQELFLYLLYQTHSSTNIGQYDINEYANTESQRRYFMSNLRKLIAAEFVKRVNGKINNSPVVPNSFMINPSKLFGGSSDEHVAAKQIWGVL